MTDEQNKIEKLDEAADKKEKAEQKKNEEAAKSPPPAEPPKPPSNPGPSNPGPPPEARAAATAKAKESMRGAMKAARATKPIGKVITLHGKHMVIRDRKESAERPFMIENGKIGTHLYAGLAAMDLTILPRYSQIAALDSAFEQKRPKLMPIEEMIMNSSRPKEGVAALLANYAAPESSDKGEAPLADNIEAMILLPLQTVSAEYGREPRTAWMEGFAPERILKRFHNMNKHEYTRGLFKHMFHMLYGHWYGLSPRAHSYLYSNTIRLIDLILSTTSIAGRNIFTEIDAKYRAAKERTIADQPSEEFIGNADADDLIHWSELGLTLRELRAASTIMSLHPWMKLGSIGQDFFDGINADIPAAFNILGLRDSVTDSFSGPFVSHIAPACAVDETKSGKSTKPGQIKLDAYVFQTAIIHLKAGIDKLNLIVPKIAAYRANLRNTPVLISEVELFFDRLEAAQQLLNHNPEYQSCEFTTIYTHATITSGGGFSSYYSRLKWKKIRYDIWSQRNIDDLLNAIKTAPAGGIPREDGQLVTFANYDTATLEHLRNSTRPEVADWHLYYIRAAQVVDRAAVSISSQTPLQNAMSNDTAVNGLVVELQQVVDNMVARLQEQKSGNLVLSDEGLAQQAERILADLDEYGPWPLALPDTVPSKLQEALVPNKDTAYAGLLTIVRMFNKILSAWSGASSGKDAVARLEMETAWQEKFKKEWDLANIDESIITNWKASRAPNVAGHRKRGILFTTAPADQLGLVFKMPIPIDEATWYKLTDAYETPTNRSYGPRPVQIETPHVGAVLAGALTGALVGDAPWKAMLASYTDNIVILPMTPKALTSVLEPKDLVWHYSVLLKESNAIGFRALGTLLVPTDPLYTGTFLPLEEVITYYEHALAAQKKPAVPRSITWFQ